MIKASHDLQPFLDTIKRDLLAAGQVCESVTYNDVVKKPRKNKIIGKQESSSEDIIAKDWRS